MMSTTSTVSFRSLRDLTFVEARVRGVELRGEGCALEVQVLAPDLLRLRLRAGENLPDTQSWAVVAQEWEPTPFEVRSGDGTVTLVTSEASFALQLEGGAWSFGDAEGRILFSSDSYQTGFTGEKISTKIGLLPEDAIFGLGETTGTFNKRGLIREFWNTDVLGHAPAIHPSLRSLYVSIPFALVWREGVVSGLFWDNPARQVWDLGQTQFDQWQMSADSGELDLYLFSGPTAAHVVERYTHLTGRMPMPPRWALGYQQCRYSYETADRVREVARTFRDLAIPCDVLYLDIHHMHEYRVFTFGRTYPKPAQLMRELGEMGFKVVSIVDPGVKDDPGFGVLKRGVKQDAFVKAPGVSTDYMGEVWPGISRFPDFLNAKVRRWWGKEQRALLKTGVAGIWNDMNEPANFALPTKTLPLDCVHRTDEGERTHAEVHNVYGMQMARASREGALEAQPDRRPFVITRAGYAGVQRYAMVWTGDNSSVWEHLSDSVQMLVNLSLSGVSFVGGDVGGFIDNTTPELFIRWLQFATFTPFFRNHSNVGTIDQEPWALGESVEALSRRYIELRYRLLPYLYSLFHESHRYGTPVLRPAWWHAQDDSVAMGCGDQFLLGDGLMIAPVMRQGAVARMVYLPAGQWYDFWTGHRHQGRRHIVADAALDTIPIYVRAGTILPIGDAVQHTGEAVSDTMELHVWAGGEGEFVWAEDDGETLAHERGDYFEKRMEVYGTTTHGAMRMEPREGAYASRVRVWDVLVRGVSQDAVIRVDGKVRKSVWDEAKGVMKVRVVNRKSALELSWGAEPVK